MVGGPTRVLWRRGLMTATLDAPLAPFLRSVAVADWAGQRKGQAMSLPAIDSYLAHCERRGFSDQTIRCYKILLGSWSRFLDGLGIDDPGPAEVQAFLDLQPAASTRATYLSWLRTYSRWALNEGLTGSDPTAKVEGPRIPAGQPRPLAEKHLALALAHADPQMRLFLFLGAKAGLRCKEIAGIHTDDLDLSSDPPMLYVSNAKGHSHGYVPLHPDIVSALRAWGVTDGYLFPGHQGGRHISPGTVGDKIAKHLRSLGIDATAHQLRHRFGSALYQSSRDIRLTQQALRHASLSSTQIYTFTDLHDAQKYWDDL